MDEDFIRDLFASEGAVEIRRLFGGRGVYLDGRIVAIDLGSELVLKADDVSAPLFEAAGSRRWHHTHPGRDPVAMPYYTMPDEAYDDPDAMAPWAKLAREAAGRVAGPPVRRRSRSRSA